MRVGVALIQQETNSFSPTRTPLDAFAEGGLLVDGEQVFARCANTNTEVAGFLEGVQAAGHRAVPLLAAWAMPGGPLEAGTLAALRQRFADALAAAAPLDGLLLALHGATAAVDECDVSGALLELAREVVGSVPVVASVDLHANVTRRMLHAADALVGYRTCPHTDHAETGRRAARVLVTMLSGRTPVAASRKLPLILPAERQDTTSGPLAQVMATARAAETNGAWAASVFLVQPWLDTPETGCAVVAVGEDVSRLEACVDGLATDVWNRRHLFDVELVAPQAAVHRALAASRGPVLLIDSADAMSSGAPGDSTVLLRHVLEATPHRSVLMTVRDPVVAQYAARCGVGSTVDVHVGARLAPAFYSPVPLRARVEAVSAGRFRLSTATLRGLEISMGTAAVLRVGHLHVVVHERAVMTNDPALYRSVGLHPEDAQAIVVKHPVGWRVGLGEMAAEAVYVDLPGASTPHLARLPYRHVPRPIYPLDDDAVVHATHGRLWGRWSRRPSQGGREYASGVVDTT